MQIFNFKSFLKRTENIDIESTELFQILSQIISQSNRLLVNNFDFPYIAGGAIRKTISGKPQDSDIDFFFRSQEQFDLFDSICAEFSGAKYLSGNDANKTYSIPFDILDGDKKEKKAIKIQLIKISFYGSIEKLFETFDFTICQCGIQIICIKDSTGNVNYSLENSTLYFSDYFLFDFIRNRLVINKITYPVASLRRMIKYTKQGFYACPGCMESFLNEVVKLNSENPQGFEKSKYID